MPTLWIGINVIDGSPVHTYLGTSEGRAKFYAAVSRHVLALGLDDASWEAVRPRFSCAADDMERPIDAVTGQLWDLLNSRNCSNLMSLFVTQLPAKEDSNMAATQSDVKYKYFHGGKDTLGEWFVLPLGAFVNDVVIGWTPSASQLPPEGRVYITPQPSAHGFRTHAYMNKLKLAEMTPGERDSMSLTEAHRFHQFVKYYCKDEIAPLHTDVVQRSLTRAAMKTNNPQLMLALGSHIRKLTNPRVNAPRGALLWGPPGTAKTSVATDIATTAGFVQVHPEGRVFAAGEMKGGIVGETEKRVKALLSRPHSCPWLHWVVVIDEIETLLTNRNDKQRGGSDNGSSSGLGVFLSYFEDHTVPNLFLFAATNLRKQVDEAAARRFEPTGMFFVGVPPASARRSWCPRTKAGAYDDTVRLSNAIREDIALLTVNFSGANMKSLMASLQTDKPDATSAAPFEVTKIAVEDCVQIIARAAGKTMGGRTSVELFREAGLSENAMPANRHQWQQFDADFGCLGTILERYALSAATEGVVVPTGRMLIDLSALANAERNRQKMTTAEKFEEGKDSCPTFDLELSDRTVHTLRPQVFGPNILTSYQPTRQRFYTLFHQVALQLDLLAVVVVDGSYFIGKGDDEAGMRTALLEEAAQLAEYKRFMLVLDLDCALIDVNYDKESKFESVHRQELFGEMLATAQRLAAVEAGDVGRMHLVVLISSFEELVSRAMQALQWPMNGVRKSAASEAQDREKFVRCDDCHLMYRPADNETRADCKPHSKDAKLISTVNPNDMTPAERGAGGNASPEATPASLVGPKTRAEAESVAAHRRNTFVWTCCQQPLNSAFCTKPQNAKQHRTESRLPPQVRSDGAACHDFPVGAKSAFGTTGTVCWCNVCSRPASSSHAQPQAATDACARCTACAKLASPGAKLCLACRRTSELAKLKPTPRLQCWFVMEGGNFLCVDDALQQRFFENQRGDDVRWEARWGPPSNTSPFKVHSKKLDDAVSSVALPASVNPTHVECYLMCRCNPGQKGAKKCVCSVSTAGVLMLVRIIRTVFDGACRQGDACSNPTLEHRVKWSH